MHTTETVIFANMCMVYDSKGNVLVQDRASQNWPGIAFPGGHVEKGESFTDAVIREIFEETGLTILNPQICGIKDWLLDGGTRYLVHLYKTNQFKGKIVSSAEGAVWWAPFRELPNMNLATGMQTTLKLFCDDSVSEQFFYKEKADWITVIK